MYVYSLESLICKAAHIRTFFRKAHLKDITNYDQTTNQDIRLVPDITLTLKKITLTLKIGGNVHLTLHSHVLL